MKNQWSLKTDIWSFSLTSAWMYIYRPTNTHVKFKCVLSHISRLQCLFSQNLVTNIISITHVALCSLCLWSLVSYFLTYTMSLVGLGKSTFPLWFQYLLQCLSWQVQTGSVEGRLEICTVSEVGVSQSQARQVGSKHTEMLAVMDN